MTVPFLILTVLFIVVSAIMVLIVLVQRPQGGGLAGAFGGAGGGSTDTVFGGRVGDALTAMTVAAFGAYLLLAILLNVMDPSPRPEVAVTPTASTQPVTDGTTPSDSTTPATTLPTIDPTLPPLPADIELTPTPVDDSPAGNPGETMPTTPDADPGETPDTAPDGTPDSPGN